MKKIALLFVAALVLASCQKTEKTAYVDNEVLIKNFTDLTVLNTKFDTQLQSLQEGWQKEGQAFQTKVQDFQENAQGMSQKNRDAKRQELLKEQQSLQQKQRFQQSLLYQQQQTAQDSLEGILKDKIKSYAKSNGYVYVFGANPNNNIYYAEDSKNITQEILDLLNADSSSDASKTTEKADSTATK